MLPKNHGCVHQISGNYWLRQPILPLFHQKPCLIQRRPHPLQRPLVGAAQSVQVHPVRQGGQGLASHSRTLRMNDHTSYREDSYSGPVSWP